MYIHPNFIRSLSIEPSNTLSNIVKFLPRSVPESIKSSLLSLLMYLDTRVSISSMYSSIEYNSLPGDLIDKSMGVSILF